MKALYLLIALLPIACQTPMDSPPTLFAPQGKAVAPQGKVAPGKKVYEVTKTDEEWRALLTPEQYYILREDGTERPFTGKYWDNHEKGVYLCAGCDKELFGSETKFESGTGWPSFYAPFSKTSVDLEDDSTYGMVRTEVVCSRCGGHLGHVFDDGPEPTGKRYCIDGNALKFLPAK